MNFVLAHEVAFQSHLLKYSIEKADLAGFDAELSNKNSFVRVLKYF